VKVVLEALGSVCVEKKERGRRREGRRPLSARRSPVAVHGGRDYGEGKPTISYVESCQKVITLASNAPTVRSPFDPRDAEKTRLLGKMVENAPVGAIRKQKEGYCLA